MNLYRIKELCLRNNITVAELERNIKMGNGTIGRWADSNPRVDSVKKVADYFHVPVDYLMGGGDTPDA